MAGLQADLPSRWPRPFHEYLQRHGFLHASILHGLLRSETTNRENGKKNADDRRISHVRNIRVDHADPVSI